jgi:hypothetical protein
LAVTGIVTPQFSSDDWTKLNDANIDTTGTTLNVAGAYMELDFGAGGRETTSVQVVHHTWRRGRANGITLTIMDDARTVLFEHTFAGITNESPMIDIFIMNQPMVTHERIVGDVSLWEGPWATNPPYEGGGPWSKPTEI